MAQLILVHGVATRSSPDRTNAEKNIETLLAKAVFKGLSLSFYAPRWGDYVPLVAPEVYDTDGDDDAFALGVGTGDDDENAAGAGALAAMNPQAALDAVLAALVQNAETDDRLLLPEEVMLFVHATEAMDDHERAVALAGEAGGDDEFEMALTDADESYGAISSLKSAIGRVTGRIRQIASGSLYGLIRDSVRPAIGLFLGDVFAYLHGGALRAKIQQCVREDLMKAWTARAQGEPLIAIGHSMGGVILVDMLSDPVSAGLPEDFKVDCLVTVGSQGGLFKAVGALKGPNHDDALLARPIGAEAWLNVFDPIDPLAFKADPIFEGVEDLTFDSATGVASAHTTYFDRPRFYARLRSRLVELKLD